MKILCIGDVSGRTGREMLFQYIEELVYQKEIDFVLANGENASHGNGLTHSSYEELTRAGVEAITMGNHTWGAREIIDLMKYETNIVRPANFSKTSAGKGSMVLTAKNGVSIGIINIIGQAFIGPYDSPFEAVNREIDRIKPHCSIILVDFHAEATSEKEAMGYFLDGRVSAVFGTHTHVQTADETILPKGTGYITDLGMTGPVHSVLGRSVKTILAKLTTGMPQKFEVANGAGQFCGCIFDIDEKTAKCVHVERVYIR